VVDRGLRESKCIQMEKLCIKPKEKVWVVNVDVQVMNHDGNLFDAASLASIAALLNAKLLKYDAENGKALYGQPDQQPLPIVDKPVEVTVAKISGKLFLDTTAEEESALDARLTIATTGAGQICAMQKGEKGFFTAEEAIKAVELAIEKGKELRALL
ncbi:MAG: RNA-binding protein, partial [Candidatus Aenigmatarchaeota archaeon]